MSKSVYQSIVIESLNENGPMTIREIMNYKKISNTKNTYLISAVKKLIEDEKVYIFEAAKDKKTLWMDLTLNIKLFF